MNIFTTISTAVCKLSFAPLLVAGALVASGSMDQVAEGFYILSNLGDFLGH